MVNRRTHVSRRIAVSSLLDPCTLNASRGPVLRRASNGLAQPERSRCANVTDTKIAKF